MYYCNVMVQRDYAFLASSDDVTALVARLCGEGCVRLDQGSVGLSAYGPHWEGDLMFRGSDGLAYSLAYDFMEVGDEVCKVFRIGIDRQPEWDSADEYVW